MGTILFQMKMVCIMRTNNDIATYNLVHDSVYDYYNLSNRFVANILETHSENLETTFLHYLVDRVHVIRCGFGIDRNMLIGGVDIGIGPVYVDAADFWSYEDSERFSMDVTQDAIWHNLRLLDEFWETHPDR